jgi:hypothetical protein
MIVDEIDHALVFRGECVEAPAQNCSRVAFLGCHFWIVASVG